MDLTPGNAALLMVSAVVATRSGTEAAKTKSSLSAFTPAALVAVAVPPVASHRGRSAKNTMIRLVACFWLLLASAQAVDSDYLLIAGSYRLSTFVWGRESFCALGEVVLPQKIDPTRMSVTLKVGGQSRATWYGAAGSKDIVIQYWLPYSEATEASLEVAETRDKGQSVVEPYSEDIELGKAMVKKGILSSKP